MKSFVLITGAAGGVGKAFAAACAARLVLPLEHRCDDSRRGES